MASTITQQKVRAAPLTAKRHRIVIVSSLAPGLAELEDVLDAACWANARWFLAMFDAGREPPCCLECSGLQYLPDKPAVDVLFATGDELVGRGYGSCGELVAFDVGRLRADVFRKGGDRSAAARAAWSSLQPEPSKPGVEKWHALERLPGAIVDVVTQVPRRTAAQLTAVAGCGCEVKRG